MHVCVGGWHVLQQRLAGGERVHVLCVDCMCSLFAHSCELCEECLEL